MQKQIMKAVMAGVISVFLITGQQGNAQNYNCVKFNREKSLKEIENKLPKIVIVGGIVRAARPGDDKFARKYHIQFIDTGCVLEDNDCLAAYNKATFEYLDKKYGRKWRKHARQDLIGL